MRTFCPSQEVGHDCINGSVGEVLVDAVAVLAQREREVVRHPQQLGEQHATPRNLPEPQLVRII